MADSQGLISSLLWGQSDESVSEDVVVLLSQRLRLVGRPDRLIRRGRDIIPVEDKKAYAIYPSTIAQMAIYFILIKDLYGVHPPYGVVVTGDGKAHRIMNTAGVRRDALRRAEEIRAIRGDLETAVHTDATPAQCGGCSYRNSCPQSLAEDRVKRALECARSRDA